MPRSLKRQPRPITRTVVSVSIPITPDWVDANRAAGMLDVTLSQFVREAVRQRTAQILTQAPAAPPRAA